MTKVIVPNPYPSKKWYEITGVWFNTGLHICRLPRRPEDNPKAEAILTKPF